ncbi:hypothetical protein V6N13_087410 [Hibiscus sabdariffa]|uniref:Uncharacterized protein n=1 Tax=Hibiscus sabdariffa TaxID=183260 RepID=A0ABR2FW66_9ROSI
MRNCSSRFLLLWQNYFNGKQVKQRALKSLCPILEANRLHSLEKRKQPKSLNCIERSSLSVSPWKKGMLPCIYQYPFASSWIFFGYYLRNQRF